MYNSDLPEDKQNCDHGTAVECTSAFCYSGSYGDDNAWVVQKGCDNDKYCPNVNEACERLSKQYNWKSCNGKCCNTDNCNNATDVNPNNSATDVITAKFYICLMVIGGYFLA